MHHCDRLLYAGDEEIPDAVLDLVDNVYIELPYACEESGDLSQPLASGKLTKDRVKLMHEYLVSGEKEIKEGQTTYFKSVGMGLFDVYRTEII